jgi:hypothetical protein
MQTIFKENKYTQTTTYFDGWGLPEAQRKLLIDFAESDAGANIFSEHIYDVGTLIDINNAIEYGCEEDEIQEQPKLIEVKEILEQAQAEGIDKITFYR